MHERKRRCMQEQPVAGATVKCVTNDRRTDAERMRGVYAQLMRSTRARNQLDTRLAITPLDGPPLRQRCFSVDRIIDLAGPIVEVDPKCQVDDSGVWPGQAIDPGDVALVDLTTCEQPLEGCMCGPIFCDKQDSRHIEVEAVDEVRLTEA